MTCFDRGRGRSSAGRSGSAQPGSMQDGDWQVGYGCASASYASNISSAAARVTVRPNGHAQVRIAGHDIGTGAYTVVAITAADRLGLPLEQVTVEMGDTELPPGRAGRRVEPHRNYRERHRPRL